MTHVLFVWQGIGHGEGDRRSEVSGVLGFNAKGTQDRLRRGHPRSALPQAEAKAQAEVLYPLNTILFRLPPPPPASKCGLSATSERVVGSLHVGSNIIKFQQILFFFNFHARFQ